MHRFNPVDAAMLFVEKRHTPFHVAMVHIYDPSTCPNGPPTFEDITEAIRKCLPLAPSFRRKIVRAPFDLDAPVWIEDEHFELEFHMRQLALPKPGNREQFRTQVSRLISRPLDLTRAPWEITVIEGLDDVEGIPSGCFALVLKIHHSAIDGKTGVAMISAMHQLNPNDPLPELEDHWEPEEAPSTRWLLGQAWLNSVKNPIKIAQIVLSKSSDLVRAAFDDMRNSEDDDDDKLDVPDSIFNGAVSPHRIIDDVIWPLEDLKKLREVVEGASINDICMAVVAETLRNYLQAKKALPEESLITTMSISIRTPEQMGEGGNQIAITRVPLFTNIADPIKRLAAITEVTKERKATKDGVVMTTLLGVVYNLPGALVGVASRAAGLAVANASAFSNTMVTNVPGSQQPMYFLGAKCVQCSGSLPLMDGGGIAHSVGSYNGNLIFGFTACREMLPDPDFYRECTKKAIQTMIKAANAPVEKPKLKRVKKAPQKEKSKQLSN